MMYADDLALQQSPDAFDRVRNRYEVPARMSGRGFRDRGIWCDHPGQRRREHEGAGRPISYVELRARVSSWPPLQLARLRRERKSVVVV